MRKSWIQRKSPASFILPCLFSLPLLASVPAHADPSACKWVSFSPQVSRFPVQTDPNAVYYALTVDQTSASGDKPTLELSGNFPFAAYFSVTVYEPNGALVSQLKDTAISAAYNPYQVGNHVLSPKRKFRIDLSQDPLSQASNWLKTPTPQEAPKYVVVLRVYEGYRKNVAGFPPRAVATGGAQCAASANSQGDARAAVDPAETSSASSAVNLPPLPVPAGDHYDFSFYRVPVSPYADGTTGYLGTSLYADKFGVIRLPHYPSFFNTQTVTPKTTMPDVDVRYISMASYGASLAKFNVLTGEQTRFLDNNDAYYVMIPEELVKKRDYAKLMKHGCNGLNFLVTQKDGKAGIHPYIILREKEPAANFPGAFSNVKLYEGNFSEMSPADHIEYAAEKYIGDYAPRGRQCSEEQFGQNACGYDAVRESLSRCLAAGE